MAGRRLLREVSIEDAHRAGADRDRRTGPDIGDPVHDFVSDLTGGAFIYSASGSAAVGVNHVTHEGEEVSQMGLTWIAGTELMR